MRVSQCLTLGYKERVITIITHLDYYKRSKVSHIYVNKGNVLALN